MHLNKIIFPFLLLAAELPGWGITNDERKLADTGVLLIADSAETVQVAFVQRGSTTVYDFGQKDKKWSPRRGNNPPIVNLVGLQLDSDLAKWQSVFGQKSPQTIGWASFWDGWIRALSSLPEPRIISYRDKSEAGRRLLLEKISAADWEGRKGKDFQGQLGVEAVTVHEVPRGGPSANTKMNLGGEPTGTRSPAQDTDSRWGKYGSWILLGVLFVFVLAGILIRHFRGLLTVVFKRSLLRLVDRICPVPREAFTAEELLGRLHQHALGELMSAEGLSETEGNLHAGAMKYALQEYVAASAQLVQHPLIAAEREVASPAAPKQDQKAGELAALGKSALALLKDRRKIRDIDKAADFLAAELTRMDVLEANLKSETARADELNQQLKKLYSEGSKSAEAMQLLRAEKASAESARKNLDGQLVQQQEALRKEKAAHERTRGERDTLSTQLEAQKRAISQQLEAEKAKGCRALEDKEREFGQTKTSLESAKNQAAAKANRLEGELTTMQQAKEKAEGLVQTLELTLESERALHVDLRENRKVLETKLARIFQANNYLRAVQKTYWDRCKHPASTGAVLYSTYLGLFQAVTGAASNDLKLESAGWTNLMNLLRRLSPVPGLEGYQSDFGPQVYPEIESMQIQGAVDNNRPDAERFVHSSVLKALLSGEVQIDGDPPHRFSLDRLRGWPLYFRVDQTGVWGAM